uniref:RING-type E3 ubiquitin transferase n=2 Tax=Arion vulgaris TaxID=1028688 RepID=A0A0B7ACF4_9EUPU
MQAKFGPDFPYDGLEGHLLYAEPDSQACGPVKPPPSTNNKYFWILLIARGGNCQFSDKVLNAQLHNYSAAIVHNYDHKDGLIPMGGDGTRVSIPSTFVGWKDGMELKRLYSYYTHKEYIIRILEDESIDYTSYLWPFLLVLAICILMVMIFLILKFLRDYASRRFSRLSNKHLKKIPIRKYKKGDYYDTCAICLEEYEEGEKIRVLPCDHVYHRKCIDPWLTKNKKTCPVCKRRVIPGRDADSESGSDADTGGTTAGGSENTPLLMGRSLQSGSQQNFGSVTGTTVVPTSHTGSAIMSSALDVDHGAVGGVGISDRIHRLHAPVISSKGNIQDGGEKREGRLDRKRKKQDRRAVRRDETARREEETRPRDDEAAGTSNVSEMRVHRERRKRRKDKKRGENRANLREFVTIESETEKKPEESTNEKDDENSATICERESSDGIVNCSEENEHETYVNPSFSENHDIVIPGTSWRRELNEVV